MATDESMERGGSQRTERDMVLAPNEFMFILDLMKGNVDVFVGATKQTLGGTERPVVFDERLKRFVSKDYETAKQIMRTAPEGYYVVLKNPAVSGKQPQANAGKQATAELDVGRKVNIPGPTSLYLWPGQMAKVLKGHHLRSNQYLLVQVYDDRAATENWGKGVVKPAEGADPAKPAAVPPKLTVGQVLVIKGTDVSFYIPPTGLSVVADADGKLVRDAVTLERLEYCLLMDENGRKRYERGPAVVFPEPTEVFVDREGSRKARAIELNENVGIYVKVIADYVENDADGKPVKYEVGDELFITGEDQMIYFPREEHAVIQYGAHDRHYGVAIPAGEGRYVLDRIGGAVGLVQGPRVFLPDPRKEVIVRRVLDAATCEVLFPGNQAAKGANAKLAGVSPEEYALGYFAGASGPMGPQGATGVRQMTNWAAMNSAASLGGRSLEPEVGMHMLYAGAAPSIVDSMAGRGLAEEAATSIAGDQIQRKGTYSAPRTLTLDTKYEGAVAVDVWTGYAMMLVRKSGERRVVVGPRTVLLEYDESPQVLSLSSGKPKSTDLIVRTAYLRVKANWVTDVVQVETKDFCKLAVKVSYRLNFEGDPEKWFAVENYVKHLCDHMRSKLRAAAQRLGVEEFYGSHAEHVRDVVLGKAAEGKPRPGAAFEENGMRVYDVEVLSIGIEDRQIADMMTGAQRQAVSTSIQLATQRRALEVTRETERLRQEESAARAETAAKIAELAAQTLEAELALDLARGEATAKKAAGELEDQKAREALRLEVAKVAIARESAVKDAAHAFAAKAQGLELEALAAEAQALVEKAGAVSPELIAALQAFGDKALAAEAARAMGPIAILGGEKGDGVVDILARLLRGTPFAKNLLSAPNGQTAVGAAE